MPDLVLRPARLSDAPTIGRVHCRAWRETYTGLLPDAMLARLSEERSAENFRREGCRNLLVAELDGEAVGFCGYGPWRGTAPLRILPLLPGPFPAPFSVRTEKTRPSPYPILWVDMEGYIRKEAFLHQFGKR